MREQKLDQALAEVETAIEISPNLSNVHETRSSILAAMGRKTEALIEIKKANTIADAGLPSR
jgi:tetratricopeptide (TPR) repeat protein